MKKIIVALVLVVLVMSFPGRGVSPETNLEALESALASQVGWEKTVVFLRESKTAFPEDVFRQEFYLALALSKEVPPGWGWGTVDPSPSSAPFYKVKVDGDVVVNLVPNKVTWYFIGEERRRKK